ncbi:DUF6942 family protein [Shewanella acanthi]|uniref:DUF6942 family protein n=1 Tax=Shewanella acanthi TaxID=2864212 RepID=UPI001C659177|nr:hypothetical protein [Shewanella acanthi]QYJ77534.1 hypothetical protein K0H61_10265 [Shewanella acanthi]
MLIGAPNPSYAFYLPNAPLLDTNWDVQHPDACEKLIALNGNHWRKVLTIMAKICVVGDDWRSYRDNLLLKQHEVILIGSRTFHPHAQTHFVCGQVATTLLGLTPLYHKTLDAEGKIHIIQPELGSPSIKHCLSTPYLDYRQYSNALIELTRAYIAAN